MSARFIVADVFDGLATLEDGSVDLVVTSPPFGWLRSYLPADHPDKPKEIGQERDPAAFIDVLLRVTAELRRVLAPHGSIAVELGDTYAGSGGAGGDYGEGGWREGQPKFRQGTPRWDGRPDGQIRTTTSDPNVTRNNGGPGFPLPKCKILIPELYRIALAYGINPLTGAESPAGRWRIRNVVTWCKPNPPVGALGDKWRPATSDIVIACTSDKRYWDDIATRRHVDAQNPRYPNGPKSKNAAQEIQSKWEVRVDSNPAGAPLLDWWELPPGGYPGSHYAVYPPALVEPLIKAMAPPKVCRTCGEPSRRITETEYIEVPKRPLRDDEARRYGSIDGKRHNDHRATTQHTLGWTDCGHDDWRPAVVLDPFVGSGTTLAVATGHGHDAIGIDLDERNYDLALERVGPLVLGPPEKPEVEVGS